MVGRISPAMASAARNNWVRGFDSNGNAKIYKICGETETSWIMLSDFGGDRILVNRVTRRIQGAPGQEGMLVMSNNQLAELTAGHRAVAAQAREEEKEK